MLLFEISQKLSFLPSLPNLFWKLVWNKIVQKNTFPSNLRVLLILDPKKKSFFKKIPETKPVFPHRYRNKSKMDNPPHPFAMANHAYHNMIHERKDQVIHMQIKKNICQIVWLVFFQRFVVTGESGAGKTVSCNVVMKMLVYLGRAPYRWSRVWDLPHCFWRKVYKLFGRILYHRAVFELLFQLFF